jgi:hypothetical protein
MSKKRVFSYGDREERRRRACERLGTDKCSCLLSDWNDPLAIELHHIAGKQYHGEVVPLCQNHHAQASDYQKDHPAKIEGCTNQLENMGHFLLGLSDLAEIVVDQLLDPKLIEFLMYLRNKLREIGRLLIEIARRQPNFDCGVEI